MSDTDSYLSDVISDSDTSTTSSMKTRVATRAKDKVNNSNISLTLDSYLETTALPLVLFCHSTDTCKSFTPSVFSLLQSVSDGPSLIIGLHYDVRKVHKSSTSQSHSLANLIPIKLGNSIRSLCGDIDDTQHLKSGGLFITCRSFNQVKELLCISEPPFTPSSTPVKMSVALNSYNVQGKIYAPKHLEVPLPDLFTALRPSRAIYVRKLLNDPLKLLILYLFSFFSVPPFHNT